MARCKTWVRLFVPRAPRASVRFASGRNRIRQLAPGELTADQFAILPPQWQPASTTKPRHRYTNTLWQWIRGKIHLQGGCLSQGSFGTKCMAFVPNPVKFTGWTSLSLGTLEVSPMCSSMCLPGLCQAHLQHSAPLVLMWGKLLQTKPCKGWKIISHVSVSNIFALFRQSS